MWDLTTVTLSNYTLTVFISQPEKDEVSQCNLVVSFSVTSLRRKLVLQLAIIVSLFERSRAE